MEYYAGGGVTGDGGGGACDPCNSMQMEVSQVSGTGAGDPWSTMQVSQVMVVEVQGIHGVLFRWRCHR